MVLALVCSVLLFAFLCPAFHPRSKVDLEQFMEREQHSTRDAITRSHLHEASLLSDAAVRPHFIL
jgi:hypothetical protein